MLTGVRENPIDLPIGLAIGIAFEMCANIAMVFITSWFVTRETEEPPVSDSSGGRPLCGKVGVKENKLCMYSDKEVWVWFGLRSRFGEHFDKTQTTRRKT